MIKCQCPSCKGLLWLELGRAARCPHCGQVVSAGAKAGASSLRASDRSGFRFLGQHGGSRRERETPFIVRGQGPDQEVLAMREARRQSLREKQQYWETEVAAIEAEFGPLDVMVKDSLFSM